MARREGFDPPPRHPRGDQEAEGTPELRAHNLFGMERVFRKSERFFHGRWIPVGVPARYGLKTQLFQLDPEFSGPEKEPALSLYL